MESHSALQRHLLTSHRKSVELNCALHHVIFSHSLPQTVTARMLVEQVNVLNLLQKDSKLAFILAVNFLGERNTKRIYD